MRSRYLPEIKAAPATFFSLFKGGLRQLKRSYRKIHAHVLQGCVLVYELKQRLLQQI